MDELIAVVKEVDGIEMGVLVDGISFLTQRGLAKAWPGLELAKLCLSSTDESGWHMAFSRSSDMHHM